MRLFTTGHAEPDPLTGSRHWYDLSGPEQDEYLLSCFKGEEVRLATQTKFDIYDRIASSIAHFLLEDYLGFEPSHQKESLVVQVRRSNALRKTLLGNRLIAAIARKELIERDSVKPEAFDYS